MAKGRRRHRLLELPGCGSSLRLASTTRDAASGRSDPNLASCSREAPTVNSFSVQREKDMSFHETVAGSSWSSAVREHQLHGHHHHPLVSPPESPRSPFPCLQDHFTYGTVRRSDSRRWSMASLDSPTFSAPQHGTEEMQPLSTDICRLAEATQLQMQISSPASGPLAAAFWRASGDSRRGTPSSQCSSDDVSTSSECPWDSSSPMSPVQQPSPRSFSGTSRINETYNLNALCRERFPKAVQQMEESLQAFIRESTAAGESAASNGHYQGEQTDGAGASAATTHDGTLSFARHQLAHLALSCLEQSRAKLLSTAFFRSLDESLDRLDKAARAAATARSADVIKKLMCSLRIITSRTARLLECLEFDPDEFYNKMEKVEGEAKKKVSTADIPQYVIGMLGLMHTHVKGRLSGSSDDGTRDGGSDAKEPATAASPVRGPPQIKPPADDDFNYVKLISNGAYGAVHLVRHRGTRQRFALKRIPKSSLVLRNQVEQAFTERDILAFADNPFVVSLYCTFETRSHLCLVLEYAEGGDCAALLKNIGGPLPVEMARLYFAETVLALEYLHSYGIVHRDLKPDNLLITSMGHIKLTDFGLSKMGIMKLTMNMCEGFMLEKESKQFTDRQVCGTPEYIAPEVILRQGYGKPVDWWSMGVILYEFLVGCVPFFGETPEELFAHVLSDGIEWPTESHLQPPAEARDLIVSLLQRDPLERLGTMGSHQVKAHSFFRGLDWCNLLRLKAEFVPNLESEEDTSYFDSRSERYHHALTDEEGSASNDDASKEDVMFRSFTSCSPRYSLVSEKPDVNKVAYRPETAQAAYKCRADEKVAAVTPANASMEHRSRPGTIQGVQPSAICGDARSFVFSDTAEAKANGTDGIRDGRQYLPAVAQAAATAAAATASPATPTSSSPTSSRDSSPARVAAAATAENLPFVVKKGTHGYGFTLRAIRVFLGRREINLYTLNHLVTSVEENGPAWSAGLRPGYIITHVNTHPVRGLNHTQVIGLVLSKKSKVTLRALPLEETTIQRSVGYGGRRHSSTARRVAATFTSAPSTATEVLPRCSQQGADDDACNTSAALTDRLGPTQRQLRVSKSSSSSSLFKKISRRNAPLQLHTVALTSNPTAAPAAGTPLAVVATSSPPLPSGRFVASRSCSCPSSDNGSDGSTDGSTGCRRQCRVAYSHGDRRGGHGKGSPLSSSICGMGADPTDRHNHHQLRDGQQSSAKHRRHRAKARQDSAPPSPLIRSAEQPALLPDNVLMSPRRLQHKSGDSPL